MNKEDEKKLENLIDEDVELLDNVHKLELTLSRIKNEGEELMRKLLSTKANG